MAKMLTGAPVAQAVADWIQEKIALLKEKGVVPTVAIVRVGERAPDLAYERGFTKKAETLGIQIKKQVLPVDITEAELLKVIDGVNEDKSVHGCLLFRPLPEHLNTRAVLCALRPEKDIDAMTGASMGGLITQDHEGYPPCTAEACLRILDFYGIPVKGRNVAMVGSGMAVGMPASIMLINRGATVSVCHVFSDPERVKKLCREADIIISAAGKAGLIGAEHVSPGQVIVDVGINQGPDGKLCGDVAFAEVEPVVDAITPVPRGVGAVTSTILAAHAVEAALVAAGL